jgi:glucokinase
LARSGTISGDLSTTGSAAASAKAGPSSAIDGEATKGKCGREIAAVDIGGTHVRFAIAEVADGNVTSLGDAVTLKTGDYANLQRAWVAFGEQAGRPLPNAVAISFAGPVHGEVLKLTNNPWVIHPARAAAVLGVDTATLINDFAAVGHAVAHIGADQLQFVCGPDVPLPELGTISIVGPGTGLGVAHILRTKNGYHVNETEGGHIDFPSLDALEDHVVAAVREKFRRVSAERIVSGPGLRNIYEALCRSEGKAARPYRDDELWEAALGGTESMAVAALERFCLSLGAVAGDITLAQGGSALVIAGGIGLRIAEMLGSSGFRYRFTAKGRFEAFMAAIPVKVLIHPQPGLLGAAAAYAQEHYR